MGCIEPLELKNQLLMEDSGAFWYAPLASLLSCFPFDGCPMPASRNTPQWNGSDAG